MEGLDLDGRTVSIDHSDSGERPGRNDSHGEVGIQSTHSKND